jgi:fatty acid desaturase
MKRLDLSLHVARLASAIALLFAFGPLHPLLAAALSMSVYFGSFAFTHDVAHGALRMPRQLTDWLLALAALPMLISGHAMRLMHLRHHARPLAKDDVEGVGAALSLYRAVLAGPANAVALRRESWAAANARERRWIAAETMAGAVLLLAALLSGLPALRVWAVMNVGLALTASAWASHLPHHPPRWARRIALCLAWTGSVTLLSFAFHDAHHARPKVPCRGLA